MTLTAKNRRLLCLSLSVLLPVALLFLVVPTGAAAQGISIDLGDDSSLANRVVQILLLVTVLSILPGLVIMITCFPFIVTVLAILRQGIGLQQSPPNMLIVTLALFLTYYVMEPVFLEAWSAGLEPMLSGAMAYQAGFESAIEPFRAFMSARVDPGTLGELQALRATTVEEVASEPTLAVLMPSFLLSEIERAFQIGFLIFLPFLVIDLVVAAVLMSMGMMMVPPAIVSLPFKLAFFVVADGWTLIATSLVRSYF